MSDTNIYWLCYLTSLVEASGIRNSCHIVRIILPWKVPLYVGICCQYHWQSRGIWWVGSLNGPRTQIHSSGLHQWTELVDCQKQFQSNHLLSILFYFPSHIWSGAKLFTGPPADHAIASAMLQWLKILSRSNKKWKGSQSTLIWNWNVGARPCRVLKWINKTPNQPPL